MRAGLLRYTITISAPASTKDSFGQPLASGSTAVLTTRAAITAISGKEVYALGAGFSGQLTHKIVIRKPAVTIRNGMTVAFQGRTFLVQFAQDPDERGRELDVFCLEQNT